jgi:hypothetical protein
MGDLQPEYCYHSILECKPEVGHFARQSALPDSACSCCNRAAIHLYRQRPLRSTACACSWPFVSPLAQGAYAKRDREATRRGEDMDEVPCIDTACPGAVLASRRRGATGKVVEVGVGAAGVVGVGARQDHALGEWLWGHGHDEATRQKLQLFAEAVVNTLKVELLNGNTWQNLVWRDTVKG